MAEDTHNEGSEEEKKENSQQDEDFGLPDLEFEELEELDLNMDEPDPSDDNDSQEIIAGSDDIDMSVLDDIDDTSVSESTLDQGIDEIEDVLDSAQLISDRLGDEDESTEILDSTASTNTEIENIPDSEESSIDDFSVESMSTESVTGLTDEELEALMTPPEPVPDVESVIGDTASTDVDDLLASIDSPDELAALGMADEEEPPEVSSEETTESSLFAADDNYTDQTKDADAVIASEVEEPEVGGSIFESDDSGSSSIFESDSIALEATPSANEKVEFQKPEEASLPSDYKPYTYDESTSGNFAKVIVVGVVIITLIGFGLLYFSDYTSGDETKKVAKKENTHKPTAKKKIKTTSDAENAKSSKETPKKVVKKEPTPAKKKVVTPTAQSAAPGDIMIIKERTGRVYAIISSFIDGDIAMDYAKKLSEQGKGVKIIQPFGKSINHRVTVADFSSVSDATASLDNLKSEYGDGVWVMKY